MVLPQALSEGLRNHFPSHFLGLSFATLRRQLFVHTALSKRASWWGMPERAPGNDFFQELCILRVGKRSTMKLFSAFVFEIGY